MTTQEELSTTVRDLVQPGKGILAADESHPTIAKRFKAVGVESSEDMRREYRSLIFSASGLGEFISGVILFEETLGQQSLDNVPMPKLLASKGIVPGIKVDKGKGPLVNAPGDEITFGLDGLDDRLEIYSNYLRLCRMLHAVVRGILCTSTNSDSSLSPREKAPPSVLKS